MNTSNSEETAAENKSHARVFFAFVLNYFIFRLCYLFVPGVILCIVGIWRKTCLWIGISILFIDLIHSIIAQIRIHEFALTTAYNPEYKELIDAFRKRDGLEAVTAVKTSERQDNED